MTGDVKALLVISEQAAFAAAAEAMEDWLCGWYGDPQIGRSDYQAMAAEIVSRLRKDSL